jgi:CBS domain-containing protein
MLADTTLPSFDPAIDVLMTPRPITVAPEATLQEAGAIMRTCRIRHLPVVEAETIVGLLSLRDVLAGDESERVREAMSRRPHVVAPATALSVACEKMLAHRFSCLPVVAADVLVGIFTATDALQYAAQALDDEGCERRHPPEVAELMTLRPLKATEPAATLRSAWELMAAARIRHLPVVHEGAVVGILSDRDLLAVRRQLMSDASPAIRVADAMSRRVSTIAADRPAADAARTLLRRRFGALPVLRGQELLGIVTSSDFLYWILGRA